MTTEQAMLNGFFLVLGLVGILFIALGATFGLIRLYESKQPLWIKLIVPAFMLWVILTVAVYTINQNG